MSLKFGQEQAAEEGRRARERGGKAAPAGASAGGPNMGIVRIRDIIRTDISRSRPRVRAGLEGGGGAKKGRGTPAWVHFFYQCHW